jgi:hypothetical protein
MSEQTKRSWLILLPLLTVIVISTLWSVYWYFAMAAAQETLASERNTLTARGLTLTCTQESWGGYPFRFEFNCASPTITAGSRLELSAANLLAVTLAYNPWQVVMLIDGPTMISGLSTVPVAAEHGRLIGSITLGSEGQASLSVDLPKLAVPGLLTSDRVRLDTRPTQNERTELAISIGRTNYQPAGRPELIIEHGDLRGSVADDRILNVDRVGLEQGEVRYWGRGEVHLDSLNRLAGKLSTETNDLNGLLAILEPHLTMTPDEKTSLRTMLGLLGRATKADIIARDGQLYIGPFKVVDLIPLY